MAKLKIKKRIAFILDLIIYAGIFVLFYFVLKNILPYHLEMGLGRVDVIEYNIITPFAGALFMVFLFRAIPLILFDSTLGMRLSQLRFSKSGSSLLKYDEGIYLLILSLILFSLQINFGQHCCGLLNPIELLLFSVIPLMTLEGIVLWIILFRKRKKSVQILER